MKPNRPPASDPARHRAQGLRGVPEREESLAQPSPLSAHIGYLFAELALEARPAAAAAVGFTAIEHPNPRSIPASDLLRILTQEGLVFAQMAACNGDPARGEKGIAALPGRQRECREDLLRCLDYAEAIGCPLVHPMAGIVAGPVEDAEAVYLDNLAFAVEACRNRPLTVLVEAISEAAVPGYFMSTLEHALASTRSVGEDDTLLLLDTFHATICGTDPTDFVRRHSKRIGHVHIADHPGRHEPGSGTIDFRAFLDQLGASGYGGAIGFEYIPSGSTEASLSWLAGWRHGPRSG